MCGPIHSTRPGRFAFAATLVAATAMALPVAAQNVRAGTVIPNTAGVTFVQNGVAGQGQSNTVETTVAERLDVTVTAVDAAPMPVQGGERGQALPFRVTNTGNGPEAFALEDVTADAASAVTVVGIAIDRDGNGLYDPAIDTAYQPGADDPLLAPGQGVTVFVLCDVASTLPADATANVSLTARAVTGTGQEGDAFPGRGEGGGDAVVGNTGADATAVDGFNRSTGSARLIKSQAVTDRLGGASPIPGSIITYTLKVEVTGNRTLDAVTVTDATPAGTTYVAGSLRLEGRTLTDAADADAGRGDGQGIEVVLGALTGPADRTVTFQVRIN